MGGCSVIGATPILHEYLSKFIYKIHLICNMKNLFYGIRCKEMQQLYIIMECEKYNFDFS